MRQPSSLRLPTWLSGVIGVLLFGLVQPAEVAALPLLVIDQRNDDFPVLGGFGFGSAPLGQEFTPSLAVLDIVEMASSAPETPRPLPSSTSGKTRSPGPSSARAFLALSGDCDPLRLRRARGPRARRPLCDRGRLDFWLWLRPGLQRGPVSGRPGHRDGQPTRRARHGVPGGALGPGAGEPFTAWRGTRVRCQTDCQTPPARRA